MSPKFRYGIGPVWTSWGFRNHSLLLGSTEIVTVPYSIRDGLRLSLALQTPLSTDPDRGIRQRAVSGRLSEEELASRAAVHHPVGALEEIRIECRWMQNAIVLRPFGARSLVFRIHRRDQTNYCRSAFRELYPALYRERGFARSGIARVLKS